MLQLNFASLPVNFPHLISSQLPRSGGGLGESGFWLLESLPTNNSFLYAAPLSLTSNLTLSASAFATGYVNSVTVSALFIIQPMQFTSVSFATNGQFQLNFLGVPGQTYVLQGSTNLLNWIPINTNLAVTNLFQLTDPGADNFPRRCYRALQQ